MARRAYISEFELDLIRIGHAKGLSSIQIGEFMKRHPVAVRKHICRMREEGTIDNLPLPFAADEIAAAMQRGGTS